MKKVAALHSKNHVSDSNITFLKKPALMVTLLPLGIAAGFRQNPKNVIEWGGPDNVQRLAVHKFAK